MYPHFLHVKYALSMLIKCLKYGIPYSVATKWTRTKIKKHCTMYTVSMEKGILLLHRIYVVVAWTMFRQKYVSTTYDICNSCIDNTMQYAEFWFCGRLKKKCIYKMSWFQYHFFMNRSCKSWILFEWLKLYYIQKFLLKNWLTSAGNQD